MDDVINESQVAVLIQCHLAIALKSHSKASSRHSKAYEALSEVQVQYAVLIVQSQSVDKQLELDMEELQIKSEKEKHQFLFVTPSGTSTDSTTPTMTQKCETRQKINLKGISNKSTQCDVAVYVGRVCEFFKSSMPV